MKWRVIRLDRELGRYVSASDPFDVFMDASKRCRDLKASSEDYFAIKELPSGAVAAE